VALQRGELEWQLLDIAGAEALPPVHWRVGNLAKIEEKKKDLLIERLREVLRV
jgi:hypothetical protein